MGFLELLSLLSALLSLVTALLIFLSLFLSLLFSLLSLFGQKKIFLMGFLELLSLLSALLSLATALLLFLSLFLSNLPLLFLTLLLFSFFLLCPDVLDRRQKYLLNHSLVVLHRSQLFAAADATP